jgi:CRISPR-associated protein Csy2
MSNEQDANEVQLNALLVLPRLRVQNANMISSPLTWGFPSITAFAGLMAALERRLGPQAGLALDRVGVICHSFEPQVTTAGYTRSFHLTRNPVLKDGGTAAIVEEGRAHLDITLVFDVGLEISRSGEAERAELAAHIGGTVAGMRVAGGSLIPPLPGTFSNPPRPQLVLLAEDPDERAKQFRRISRRWLPGFALVSRDDLLQTRRVELQATQPGATLLDAWLDLSGLNHRATRHQTTDEKTGEPLETIEWQTDARPGWTVPIPVGFASLTELQQPGTVAGARDESVPFRFVESVYSLGQWISPHRLTDVDQLVWRPIHDPASGLYHCINAFRSTSVPVSHTN